MRNNKDSFRPGSKKPFPRDGGKFNRSNNSGDFKRNDKNFSSGKSGTPGKPAKFNKFGEKSNYSSNSSNFTKNNDRGYNKFKKYDNPGGFDRNRNDRNDNRNENRNYNKNDGFKKFDRFDKSDKKFTPGDNKPKFDRFKKPDKKFDKPFEKRYDRKPEKFEKIEKMQEQDNIGVIVTSVEQEDSGMVYGRNAVIELLKSGRSIDKLFVQSGQREGSITMIFAEAVKKSIPVIEVEKAKLDSMINNSAHQGVIALASEKDYCSVDDILQIAEERGEKAFILIADRIMDPHNLGAIIRTAECAGVHGIIIPKRNSAGVSPIVAKTSAGASIHMAIAKVANIANTIEELKEKGIWVISSASENSDAEDYDTADYNLPTALVVGNEGEGLSPIVIQKSDFLVKIPMLGKIESLNVSCAAAILMYEVSRQRKQK